LYEDFILSICSSFFPERIKPLLETTFEILIVNVIAVQLSVNRNQIDRTTMRVSLPLSISKNGVLSFSG
jgi:hypothetical protein